MNIEAFLLCDAATNPQGRLNVLGAFDNIFAKKMPVQYPACAVAIRIRFEQVEEGEHPMRINIIDEDGIPVGPKLDGSISVKTRPGLDSSVVNLVLNLQGLEFKKYGKYRIDLAVDGQIKGSLPLTVREVPSK